MTIPQAYDPESFRTAGHRLVDSLADYLERAAAGDMPVLQSVLPGVLMDEVAAEFPTEPTDDVVATLMEVVRRSTHVHHPKYLGHQISAPVPSAILAEMTTALLNNGMAIYEMGQLHTVMERHVVRFLASTVGFPDAADGILTGGGSLGNLTALLAARQAKAGHDIWTEGQSKPLAVLVSDQAHYSISRSVQIMGWGADGAISVPTDECFRMRVDRLNACLQQARDSGRTVLAVVASSCSTATGSFDPLPELAEFCAKEDLWLHVDGAHGASLALSKKHRTHLDGIERADSVVWDLHKMMALPALNTAVLFRDGSRSYQAFAQDAAYLFDQQNTDRGWFNTGQRVMECTKRGMSVTAYCMLRGLGTRFFADNVDRLVDRTRELAELLTSAEDFEIATSPAANILCFRHRPPGVEELDPHQTRIRQGILDRGAFYIVQTRLRGAMWLRVTVMSPMTSSQDLADLVAEVRACARPN